jgi:hypothetical protein
MSSFARSAAGLFGALTLAAAGTFAASIPRAMAAPPGFPNLDTFTPVAIDDFVAPLAHGAVIVNFSALGTVTCDFYGGPPPPPGPLQNIDCEGAMPGLQNVPLTSGGPAGPEDCVYGVTKATPSGYQLQKGSYSACNAPRPVSGKPLTAGQKVSYLNVTCAAGDQLLACLDTTGGEHGFVLQPSGSWAF